MARALYHLIREVVIADPALGLLYVLKEDVNNGLYCILLRPIDAPNLGLVFPSDRSGEERVAITLTLSMVSKNRPPILCRATDTVADLTNATLLCNQMPRKHKLDDHAEALVILDPTPLQASLTGFIHNPYLSCTSVKPNSYVYFFIDEFLGVSQGHAHRQCHVRCTLFHAMDKVF